MLNLSDKNEVLEFFEMWMLRQFNNNAATLENCFIHSKAELLINEDCEFWQNQPMWNLYDKAKELALA